MTRPRGEGWNSPREWRGKGWIVEPSEVKAARLRLGLTLEQMASMLGYQGGNLRSMQFALETGKRPLREPQRRLLIAYLEGYRPRDWGIVPRETE